MSIVKVEPPPTNVLEFGWIWMKWVANLYKWVGAEAGSSLQLQSYTVAYITANLPAENNEAGFIFVSDETGGAVTAFSDGTDWRRTTDRAIVS